jgi:benzoyl-CoA reductase/2-hydroxyglutaryl-CoA dehydratase subunit BcrC/BadD/HgdB
VKQLDEQETRIEAIRREVTSLTAERAKAQTALEAFIEGIAL